ncbi:uncharacterized protein BDZ99DRAFT_270676 [Mytilinidion resinicola]|uniref:Zn(2)-C6 fungal-type domain-containing protein n=1 Tax=Mytilinidion resinicola TaxID=574789 RepID=A0A6A6YXD5_9PEZI|nr:uncharacterized protein BDZ99DRAFT_270676 [Mytilinidion resinicola]KAF2812644.1 hypothetical protein BDZ99DRAFT_270676 [Mytilinidion resinicola]
MQRRSRTGCIDCRRAKVKCDEAVPTCGTCERRGRRCQGYAFDRRTRNIKWKSIITVDDQQKHENNNESNRHLKRKRSESDSIQSTSPPEVEQSPNSLAEQPEDDSPTEVVTLRISDWEVVEANLLSTTDLSPFPIGDCSPEDRLGLCAYFDRHPHELVIGSEPEFVKDMNMHFLSVFQQNPEAMRDVLCGIGQVYLHRMGQSSSLVRALDKRAKTLARIRSRNEIPPNIEFVLAIILGICGLELIDTNYGPGDFSLQILHSTTAVFVNQYLSTGSILSATSKFFLRGLARQEMMIAITQRRRPSIACSLWLDSECYNTADRFMGFTMTIMPLWEEICGLAEDMKRKLAPCSFEHDLVLSRAEATMTTSQTQTSLETAILHSRAAALRTRLESWHPPSIPNFSGSSSQKFFRHAATYRSAGLLYLHRLLYMPGQSAPADNIALSLAYDIFAHLTGPFSWLRLSLLPTLIAACEFRRDDDRKMALGLFEGMYGSRNTFTTDTTKRFVVNRVWPSLDSGEEVSWMELADRYPGECVPI